VGVFGWAIYPKVLSRTRDGLADEEVRMVVNEMNELYGTVVVMASFIAILALPLLFRFLPQYREGKTIIVILLLAQAVLSGPFGSTCLGLMSFTVGRAGGRASTQVPGSDPVGQDCEPGAPHKASIAMRCEARPCCGYGPRGYPNRPFLKRFFRDSLATHTK
jgi:hypothetical protein